VYQLHELRNEFANALGDRQHWPIQTIRKRQNAERGRFYVPDRDYT
jgi:hypothetical protein